MWKIVTILLLISLWGYWLYLSHIAHEDQKLFLVIAIIYSISSLAFFIAEKEPTDKYPPVS